MFIAMAKEILTRLTPWPSARERALKVIERLPDHIHRDIGWPPGQDNPSEILTSSINNIRLIDGSKQGKKR